MFKFITGDILESGADCLVNTVNCEGYMGKGIAYQFKLKFPLNDKDYVQACKKGQLSIGHLHYFKEKNKIIVNFPTKDKWRQKSKIDYIEKGLAELVKLIPELEIKSIAIPPLGCGNGGLNWFEVKPILVKYLTPFVETLDLYVYEPSLKYYKPKVEEAPRLNASHLILMQLKPRLKMFNKLRLQKAAYFMNLFSNVNYFKFDKYKFGPYAHSIDILIKDIKQFQDFYKVQTNEAINLAKKILISKTIEQKLNDFSVPVESTISFVNDIETDKELELLATVCAVIEDRMDLTEVQIIDKIKTWSKEKAEKFSEIDIINAISYLEQKNLIKKNLIGSYNLNFDNSIFSSVSSPY